VAGVEAYLRAEFHLDPSNRLATIHQGRRETGQERTGQTNGGPEMVVIRLEASEAIS